MSTPNVNIHFTLVGSNFHDSFVDSLKSKPQECTYTMIPSFVEYKVPEGREAHVVVLNGHDDELAKASTLAALLDQPIVLAFFAPTGEVLEALHEAANCLVSIPSIKVDDGAPIIIHRCPHDGIISVTSGFGAMTDSELLQYIQASGDEIPGQATSDSDATIATSAPATPEEKLSAKFKKSVDVIRLTLGYLLELLQRDRVQSMAEIRLNPPAGTMFYKTVEFALNSSLLGEFVSRLRVHAYCANAKPTEPDFVRKGGVIYVVAVLSGHATPSFAGTGPLYDFIQPGGGSLTGLQVEPQSWSTSGSSTTYYIKFGVDLKLWSSSKFFIFPATYEDSFTLDDYKQKTISQNQGNYSLSITPYKSSSEVLSKGAEGLRKNTANNPLNALFSWTTSCLTTQPIELSGGWADGDIRIRVALEQYSLDLAKW